MPLLLCFLFTLMTTAQTKNGGDAEKTGGGKEQLKDKKKIRIYYGTASYYADQFIGRLTASGEPYDHVHATAACNILPLGTWIRVTNISNRKSVIVKVNDRLHPRMKRLVDLSRGSAEVLGYTKKGLTQVRVEVLGVKRPKEAIATFSEK